MKDLKNQGGAAINVSSTALSCDLQVSRVVDPVQCRADTNSPCVGRKTSAGGGRSIIAAAYEGVNRQEHLQATINHFDDLSSDYDHYALKRQAYLHAVDRIILGEIGRRNPCTCLDVGCGTGRLLSQIKEVFPASRGFGIDLSPQMIEICRNKGLDVTHADFFAFTPATAFDVVFLEFNVFGYLIVQNGLAGTIEHLRRLVDDRGCIIFDILNPLCLTYTRLRQSLPTAIDRCWRLLTKNGECHFTYSVGGNPVAMGLASPSRVESLFCEAGYTVRRHCIKYADHRWLKILPRLFTSQFLFVVSR